MDAADHQDIEVRVEDGIMIVTLNRPDKLNAYTPRMGQELAAAFRAADADDAVGARRLLEQGHRSNEAGEHAAAAAAFGAAYVRRP